ncbi:transcription factor [Colletotrichum camelliae]|nr:transcription factor [Colletotrichum camelliae]
MSTAIVYEGVPGAQGTLFQGKKFFVTQRVPDRTTILDLIKQNGGKIVKLDKHADLVIADHVRRDCPPESLSWNFIKDSVQYGAMQEEDKYQINQSPMAARPVGSTKPAKGTRTPFTNADDAELARWVLSHTKTSGNDIYQQFEQINNRHTWHSWRDRWVKKLKLLPYDAQRKLADSALPESQPPAGSLPASQHDGPQTTRSLRPAARQAGAHPQVTPATRSRFTKEDDELLLRSVSELEQRGGRIPSGLFQDLAKKYPRHTSASWQKHRAESERRLRQSFVKDEPMPDLPAPGARPATSNVGHDSASGRNERDPERATTTNIGSNKHINKPSSAPIAEESIVVGRNQLSDVERSEEEHDDEGAESQDLTREQFYKRLEDYRNLTKQDPNTNISGRPLDLWLLWSTVRNVYARGGIELDWEDITKELSFPRDSTRRLKECYNEYAEGFFSTLDDGDDDDDDDSGDKEIVDQGGAHAEERKRPRTENEADAGTDDEILISLPTNTPGASRKRSAIQMDAASAPSTPNGRKKRHRLGPNDEIPPTPEEKIGLAGMSGFDISPSLSGKESASTSAVRPESRETEGQTGHRARHVEPETQDFGFDDEDHERADSQHDSFDISPSQQLFDDFAAATPLPSSLRNNGFQSRHREPNDSARDRSQISAGVEKVIHGGSEDVEPESQGIEKIAQLDGFIESFEGFGYPREDVLTALISTSICMPLATAVLKHMKQHKSIPRDWEGVWTEEDDRRLKRVDRNISELKDDAERTKLKKSWDFLVRKHTQKRIEQRREFLDYLGEAEGMA